MNKKTKNIINAVLIVFVVGSAAYLVADQILSKPQPAPVQTPSSQPAQPMPAHQETEKLQDSKVIVYYFYTNVRCPTCRKLETYTKKALDEAFEQKLQQGKLQYKPINVDEPGNKHYIDDYQLYTKTVIVAKVQDNRQLQWKNLKNIWRLVGNERKYLDYIQSEVHEYIGEK